MKAIIEEKHFGTKRLFENAVFDIPVFSHTAILGPSGCGKTTLMRILSGLDKDFAGRIENGPRLPVVLFQEDRLQERLSVISNLMAVTENKEKACSILSSLSLSGEERTPVRELSGGMKRRLSLAIALLGHPELLILDEPTVGIDPALRRKIWQELKALRDRGQSILITTHVMDETEQTDRVALLLHGDVIAFASPKELERQYEVPTIEDVFLKAEKEEQENENTRNN